MLFLLFFSFVSLSLTSPYISLHFISLYFSWHRFIRWWCAFRASSKLSLLLVSGTIVNRGLRCKPPHAPQDQPCHSLLCNNKWRCTPYFFLLDQVSSSLFCFSFSSFSFGSILLVNNSHRFFLFFFPYFLISCLLFLRFILILYLVCLALRLNSVGEIGLPDPRKSIKSIEVLLAAATWEQLSPTWYLSFNHINWNEININNKKKIKKNKSVNKVIRASLPSAWLLSFFKLFSCFLFRFHFYSFNFTFSILFFILFYSLLWAFLHWSHCYYIIFYWFNLI